MSQTSLYDATIRYVICTLKSLQQCLQVSAQAVQQTAQIDEKSLMQARLIEDMKPLSYQVHQATRIAARLAAVMLGKSIEELPTYSDDLTTLAVGEARIDEVLAGLATVDPAELNARGEGVSAVVMVAPTEGKTELTGAANAFGAAMPNINFHAVMAYAILRKEGIPLGKKDYLQKFTEEYC